MIVVYAQPTGRISQVIHYDSVGYVPALADGESFLVVSGVDIGKDYVLNGEVSERPVQSINLSKNTIAADGVDIVTITGAVDGSELIIKSLATGETVSGPINPVDSLFSTVTGTLHLTVKKWPYLDWIDTIEAV